MGCPEIEDQEMEDSMHARGCVWPGQEGVNPPRNYSFQRANARQEEVSGGSTGQKWELADQEKAKPPVISAPNQKGGGKVSSPK